MKKKCSSRGRCAWEDGRHGHAWDEQACWVGGGGGGGGGVSPGEWCLKGCRREREMKICRKYKGKRGKYEDAKNYENMWGWRALRSNFLVLFCLIKLKVVLF